jgi:hypothetical protein
MAEHEVAKATTSSSPKALWLAALDALDQEYREFHKRSGGAGVTAHADDTGPRSAPEQLGARPVSEPELADAGAITLT